MRIVHRNPLLKYPRAICREKLQLVLTGSWNFGSPPLLSWPNALARRATRPTNSFACFARTGSCNGLPMTITTTSSIYMLTRAGAAVLHEAGRDIANAWTSPSRLIRYPYIMHDLAVQQAAISRLDNYTEVISEHHIVIPEPFHRPDMLMRNPKNFWLAFEYERSRKQTKRIFISFNNHAQASSTNHYHGTYFLFDRESDMAYYRKLFDSKEWPKYNFNRSTGKLTPKDTPFQPDTVTNLRKCFLFIP